MHMTVRDRKLDGEFGFGFGIGDFKLLLRRMEALALAPAEVMRLETWVLSDLAAACAGCTNKPGCAQDLCCTELAGDNWGAYCPNTAVLQAMADLPWFAIGERTRA